MDTVCHFFADLIDLLERIVICPCSPRFHIGRNATFSGRQHIIFEKVGLAPRQRRKSAAQETECRRRVHIITIHFQYRLGVFGDPVGTDVLFIVKEIADARTVKLPGYRLFIR